MSKDPREHRPDWYFRNQTGEHGPCPLSQMRQLVESGRINRETPVRWRNKGEWRKASEIRGLFLLEDFEDTSPSSTKASFSTRLIAVLLSFFAMVCLWEMYASHKWQEDIELEVEVREMNQWDPDFNVTEIKTKSEMIQEIRSKGNPYSLFR